MPFLHALIVSLLVSLSMRTTLAAPPTIRWITDGDRERPRAMQPAQGQNALSARTMLPSRAIPTDLQSAMPLVLRDTLWSRVAAEHALDPRLLYAVALEETRRAAGPDASSPWPFTLRGPDGPQFHHTQADAARALRHLLEYDSPHAIDVGLMQINLHWHGKRVQQPEQLLDPRTNLAIGARILAEALRSAPNDRVLGIGRYHQWRDDEVARAYGQRVLGVAEALANGAFHEGTRTRR